MKQIRYAFGLVILLSVIFVACKEDSLEAMRDRELETLDKYVKDTNLATYKDASGIYFKDEVKGTGDTIKSGFKVMLQFNIMLIDSSVVFTTEDDFGQTYEEMPFYVDVSNDAVNQNYVQQIAGMHIGLKKMQVGGRAFMVIPSELAFKAVDNSSTLGIPRFSTLLVKVYAKKGYSPNQQ